MLTSLLKKYEAIHSTLGWLEGIFKVALEKYALLASSVQIMVDEKLFENMVVSDIRKQMFNQGCD